MNEEKPHGTTKPEEVLGLRLLSDKSEVPHGTPLALRVFLDNLSDGPLVVLARASHVDLSLGGTNEKGEFIVSLLPPSPPPPPSRNELATIPAGESLELKRIDLLRRINGQIESGNGNAGRFEIRASYVAGWGLTEHLRTMDPDVWVGKIGSNTVFVTILPA